MNNKSWWVTTIIIIIIFLCGSAFIMLRKTDGAGVYQTQQASIAAEIILGIVLLVALVVQVIWLAFIRRKNKQWLYSHFRQRPSTQGP